MVGDQRALIEVDGRIGHRRGDVGIGGEVDDEIVTRHRLAEAIEIVRIRPHNLQARVVDVIGVVPLLPGREVVIESQLPRPLIGQQRVGEVTADEPGAADDDHPLTAEGHAGTRHTAEVLRPNLWR